MYNHPVNAPPHMDNAQQPKCPSMVTIYPLWTTMTMKLCTKTTTTMIMTMTMPTPTPTTLPVGDKAVNAEDQATFCYD